MQTALLVITFWLWYRWDDSHVPRNFLHSTPRTCPTALDQTLSSLTAPWCKVLCGVTQRPCENSAGNIQVNSHRAKSNRVFPEVRMCLQRTPLFMCYTWKKAAVFWLDSSDTVWSSGERWSKKQSQIKSILTRCLTMILVSWFVWSFLFKPSEDPALYLLLLSLCF